MGNYQSTQKTSVVTSQQEVDPEAGVVSVEVQPAPTTTNDQPAVVITANPTVVTTTTINTAVVTPTTDTTEDNIADVGKVATIVTVEPAKQHVRVPYEAPVEPVTTPKETIARIHSLLEDTKKLVTPVADQSLAEKSAAEKPADKPEANPFIVQLDITDPEAVYICTMCGEPYTLLTVSKHMGEHVMEARLSERAGKNTKAYGFRSAHDYNTATMNAFAPPVNALDTPDPATAFMRVAAPTDRTRGDEHKQLLNAVPGYRNKGKVPKAPRPAKQVVHDIAPATEIIDVEKAPAEAAKAKNNSRAIFKVKSVNPEEIGEAGDFD